MSRPSAAADVLRGIGLLREHGLRPGALVFDRGAHPAVVAMMLGRMVEPGGRVVAVEASTRKASA
jgi:tRNA A58 N-methylase Trm61